MFPQLHWRLKFDLQQDFQFHLQLFLTNPVVVVVVRTVNYSIVKNYLTIIFNFCLFVCLVTPPRRLGLKGSNFQCLMGSPWAGYEEVGED